MTATVRTSDYLPSVLVGACGACGGYTTFSATCGIAVSFSATRDPLSISYAPLFAAGSFPTVESSPLGPWFPDSVFRRVIQTEVVLILFSVALTPSFAVPSPLKTPLPRLPDGPESGWAIRLWYRHDAYFESTATTASA